MEAIPFFNNAAQGKFEMEFDQVFEKLISKAQKELSLELSDKEIKEVWKYTSILTTYSS